MPKGGVMAKIAPHAERQAETAQYIADRRARRAREIALEVAADFGMEIAIILVEKLASGTRPSGEKMKYRLVLAAARVDEQEGVNWGLVLRELTSASWRELLMQAYLRYGGRITDCRDPNVLAGYIIKRFGDDLAGTVERIHRDLPLTGRPAPFGSIAAHPVAHSAVEVLGQMLADEAAEALVDNITSAAT
jgi:hypothetical protein